LPVLSDRVLAAVYRRAAIVLLPSEREGFGLPLIEAMACGTLVVASDLPVLREVGGAAATYCAGFDGRAWAEAVLPLLDTGPGQPDRWAERRDEAAEWARRFTWERFTDRIADIYQDVARTARPAAAETAICPA
jgi:glycosyltransferase involved in cell wall biosynthesis